MAPVTLEAFRKQRGLSQAQLAESVGLRSKAYISRLESGVQPCSIRLALQLEELSEGVVPAETLVTDDDSALLGRFLQRRRMAAAA